MWYFSNFIQRSIKSLFLTIFTIFGICNTPPATGFPTVLHSNNHNATVVSVGEFYSFSVSPDGMHSCVTNPSGAFLLDWNFNIIHHFPARPNYTIFSPDGSKLLVLGYQSYIYDVQTREVLFRPIYYVDRLHLRPFSPDGRDLILTNVQEKVIQTIDLTTGERTSYPGILKVRGLPGPPPPGYEDEFLYNDYVFFSADNKYLMASGAIPYWITDKTPYLEFWNRESGELEKRLSLEKVMHQQSPFYGDGVHIVIGDGPGDNTYAGYEYLQYYTGRYPSDIYLTPVLWDGATGKVLQKWPEIFFNLKDPRHVNLSKDRRWLTIGFTVVDLTSTDGSVKQIPTEEPYTGYSENPSLDPTQPLYYRRNRSDTVSTIEAWNLETLAKQDLLVSYFYVGSRNTALSSNSFLVALNLSTIWNYEQGEEVARLALSEIPEPKRASFIGSADFSPDGKYFLRGELSSFSLWNAMTWEKVFELETGIQDIGTVVKFSPDGKQFVASMIASASMSSETLYEVGLWDTESHHLLQKFNTTKKIINSLIFSSDGNWVASGAEFGSRLYNISKNEPVESYYNKYGGLKEVYGFLPNSTQIIGRASNDSLIKADAVTGEILGELWKANSPVVLTPDGHHLICGSVVYDAQTLDSVLNLEEERKDYQKMFISRDGKHLFTHDDEGLSQEGIAKVWDLESLLYQNRIDSEELRLHP